MDKKTCMPRFIIVVVEIVILMSTVISFSGCNFKLGKMKNADNTQTSSQNNAESQQPDKESDTEESQPDKESDTENPQPEKGVSPSIDPKKKLTFGEFIWLWMKHVDGSSKFNKSIDDAVDMAVKGRYISDKKNKNDSISCQQAAYLLINHYKNNSNIDTSHYTWQIFDLNDADSSYRQYLIRAYAAGIITTSGGSIHPKQALVLNDAEQIIERTLDSKKCILPPNYEAPYFEYKGLVELVKIDPSLILDLKYATKDNFTGVVHYPRVLCLLDAYTAKKLVKANQIFHSKGYYIKIWDAYRPVSVQWSLYKAAPANLKKYAPAPSKYSQHSKGIAADITLTDKNGKEIPMPTKFDDFTERAHPDYNNLPKNIISNRNYLRSVMEGQGFEVYSIEWWHYYLPQRNSLSISTVTLDDFAEKRDAFYIKNIQNYISGKK